MLEITSIKNGFVLDHIRAGVGVKIFKYLKLEDGESEVALIINANSMKNGRKDIIKIENATEIDFTVLALLSPGITINEIKNEVRVRKIKPSLPKQVKGIINCDNPRCEIDFTVLALLSPGITINEIKNEVRVRKIKPSLPKQVKGIINCDNPRCITNDEKYLEHVFDLVNEDNGSYKCQYCDTIINLSEV